MSWRRCVTVAVVLAAVALLRPAQATDLRTMRAWDGHTHTRAVIELSGPLDYKLFQLQHPGRIVLDLEDSRVAHGFQSPENVGVIKDVRTGRHGKHGTRVVLDLTAAAHPRSFLLKPDGDDGYRLVIDLYSSAQAAAQATPTIEAPVPAQERKVVVAIDAGHGGKDPGSHGPSGLEEKTVTLAVARDLAKLIDAQPGMKAVLTRTGDRFIPLKRRYEIARRHNADLFISIHADAFTSRDAKGSSVWVLSPRGKTSEAARWLADRENRADLIGGVSLDDKDDTLAKVLLDLQQGYAMQASDNVAKNVLHALAELGPTHRGYVEKANFVVLRSPDVPSILVETAFITNPREERKLRSPSHREKLAAAILDGVRHYFTVTPPQGTWFAAQAARRHEEALASRSKPAAPSAPTLDDVVATVAKADTPDASAVDDSVRDLHRVSAGETLSGIAREYGVSIHSLKIANRMDDDTVRTGSVLAIPTG